MTRGEKLIPRFALKRLLYTIPILFVTSALVFFLIRLAPSDPVGSITGGKQISVETQAALVRQFHLDQSLPRQYLLWLGGVFKGDLGTSFRLRQTVTSLIAARLPTTLQLVLMAVFFAVVISIPAGIAAALRKNTAVDRALSLFMVAGVSSPSFLNAIVLMMVFALRLRWFPAFGTGGGFVDNLYYLCLPALALSFTMIALMGRITRSRMIEELGSPYVLALKAKGTRLRDIVLKHCLKNTLVPVITVAGIWAGAMVVNAVLVENVFALGGIGRLLIDSIKASDYPVVQSLIMLLVLIFLLLTFFVDILYAIIDPRIRQGGTGYA
jgi:peptide/nickel transport system permease protein